MACAPIAPLGSPAEQDSATILAFNEASTKLQAELEQAYQRWNELDA